MTKKTLKDLGYQGQPIILSGTQGFGDLNTHVFFQISLKFCNTLRFSEFEIQSRVPLDFSKFLQPLNCKNGSNNLAQFFVELNTAGECIWCDFVKGALLVHKDVQFSRNQDCATVCGGQIAQHFPR